MFTTTILARIAVGGLVGFTAAAILFVNGWAALRATRSLGFQLPGQLAGSPLEASLNQINLYLPVGLIAALLGILMGTVSQALWEDAMLYLYGGVFEWPDPIFGTEDGVGPLKHTAV